MTNNAPSEKTGFQSSATGSTRLWTTEFTLLFLLAAFANVYLAVFYGFEHWLSTVNISPQWRGVLLGSLGLGVMSARPFVSVWLMQHRGLLLMACALLTNSMFLVSYSFTVSPYAIMFIRFFQGSCIAVMTSVSMSVLVECIPKGQSTKAFAAFSLTMVLPYSIVPIVAEQMLPHLSEAAHLYAYAALLGIPSLLAMYLLSRRLPKREQKSGGSGKGSGGGSFSLKHIWNAIFHSGLFLAFLSVFFLACAYFTVFYFMKSLCASNGVDAGLFFTTYTAFVIIIRFFAGGKMDKIPRIPGILLCAAASGVAFMGFAFGPTWLFMPFAALHGLGSGILYPMLAATVYDMSTPETRSINSNTLLLFFDAAVIGSSLIGGIILDMGFSYEDVFFNGSFYLVIIIACMTFFAPRWKRRHELVD